MKKKLLLQMWLKRFNFVTQFNYVGNRFDRVLILGNGPSLNLLEPDDVREYDCVIVSNHFYATPLAKFVRPNFYCISDPRLFLPPDRKWINNARLTRPDHFVVPMSALALGLIFKMNCLYYEYDDSQKLWDNNVKPKFNLSTEVMPTGDSVLSDIMVPLAVTLGAKEIAFSGVDLKHNRTASHAYPESQVLSKRRDDAYLVSTWPDRVSQSLKKQLISLTGASIILRSLHNEQELLTSFIRDVAH